MHETPRIVAIVEDDTSVSLSLARLVLALGYRAKGFKDAEGFLLALGTEPVHCVIIDIDLGGALSGLNLGERLATDPHAPPVILMTGDPSPERRMRAAEIGCVDFLEKPIAAARLQAALLRASRDL